MSLLQERLSSSLTDAAITDVIEEYECPKGNVGLYGANYQGRRVVIAATLDGNDLSVSTPNQKEVVHLLALIRKLMRICGIEPLAQKAQNPRRRT